MSNRTYSTYQFGDTLLEVGKMYRLKVSDRPVIAVLTDIHVEEWITNNRVKKESYTVSYQVLHLNKPLTDAMGSFCKRYRRATEFDLREVNECTYSSS